MPELIALRIPGGPVFVEELRRVWDAGDAVLPVDVRLPPPALDALLGALRPRLLVDQVGPDTLERRPLPSPVPVVAGDAVVVATSGSTGIPKGVVHTHDSVAASSRATTEGLGVDPSSDRWLCSLPVAHVAGLSVVLRSLWSGTPVEVLPAFDAEAVRDAARRGATLTTLVPTALARIDPAAFRRIVIGGTHPPDVLPPNCVVSYGLTETGSAICYDGRPLRGAEVRLDERGQVLVRGPMLLRAYRTGTPEGADPRDAQGWFATGDMGAFDDEGRLTILGRRGDLIVTGGQNVWPLAVERALSTHPEVVEVAVVGRPDPEWGEVVTAVVVPRRPAAPPDLGTLRRHVKGLLPAYAAPRALELVDDLPRTALGKLDRRRLPAPDGTGPAESGADGPRED